MSLSSGTGHISLTVSMGVADWTGPRDSMSALLKRADDALYAAKHGGRDRVGSGLIPRALTALRSA